METKLSTDYFKIMFLIIIIDQKKKQNKAKQKNKASLFGK